MNEGQKISELTPVETLYGGCCFPIVQNGETRKVLFETIQELLRGNDGEKGERGTSIRVTGEWIALNDYQNDEEFIDFVTWNGNTYGCKISHRSRQTITPENSDYWQLLVAKGDQGIQGEKGEKGDTGEQGIQGEKGDKGDKGDAFTYKDFTPEQLAVLTANLGASGSSPIGAIIPFGGENVPAGFLLCDGEEYSKEDYKDLYAVIGDYFTKDTVTAGYFNVPDLRGKFAEGAEGNLGTNIDAGLPNITGEIEMHNNLIATTINTNNITGAFTINQTAPKYFGQGSGQEGARSIGKLGFNASSSNKLYGKSDTVQPPAVAVNYIIKATSTREDLDEIIDDTSHDVGHALSAAEVDRRIESPNTYSTEETRIGTWIDGKPLYRKVCPLPAMTLTQSWQNTGFYFPNHDVCRTMVYPADKGEYGDGRIVSHVSSGEKYLYVKRAPIEVNNITIAANKVYIVVEYTKTTD